MPQKEWELLGRLVVVVHWLIVLKEIIVRGADLSEFCSLIFVGKMCFVSRPLKSVSVLRKNGDLQNGLLGKRHIPKPNHGNRPGFRRKKLQQQR